MSLTRRAVEGYVPNADASIITNGKVLFIPSGFDTDITDEAVVVPTVFSKSLAGDGTFSAMLWPNVRGNRATSYSVVAEGVSVAQQKVVRWAVGGIQVPDSVGPHRLEVLINNGVPPVTQVAASYLTPGELEALVQAAEDAADEAAASALKVETVQIDQRVANYTLQLSDKGKLIEMNAAAATTFTIPTDAAGLWDATVFISLSRIGVGVVNITASAGVTLNGIDGGTAQLLDQYGACHVYRRAANAWIIIGGIGDVT